MSKPTNAAIVDLNGRKWDPFEVKGARGHVTYTEDKGEIHVPYGADPVSKTIQAHELAHVRYTSKVWPNCAASLKRLTALAKTTNAIVGYAEDMRITALAGRLGVKTLPTFGDRDDAVVIDRWVESFVGAGVPRDRVQRAIRFILGEHTSVVKTIGLDLRTLQQKDNAERYIAHCAGFIHSLLSKPPKPEAEDKPEDKGGDKGKGKADKPKSTPKADADKSPADAEEDSDEEKGDDSSSGDADDSSDAGSGDAEGDEAGDSDSSSVRAPEGEGEGKGDGDPTPGGGADGAEGDEDLDLSDLELPDIRDALVSSVPAPPNTEALIQRFQHTLDTADWIPVKSIKRMPLVRRAAQSRNRGRKLSEVGVALGSAYDAVSPNERRPFLAKRRGGVGGLTVLIDCSSSMHIDAGQLEHLLTAHPQGVVVTYNSLTYGPGQAEVRIIASHGRLAAQEDFRAGYSGNGCDGPVLEWLAKQTGERVWVCDGVITGKGDRAVSHDENERDAWLKAHRVTRFHSLNEYLGSLT